MDRDRGEDGISEVVGFVIILAVVMAGLSLYLTYAVPVQGREEEITVMDGVRAWFVDYKIGVDQLWLNSPLFADPDADVDEGRLLFKATIQRVKLSRVIDSGTVREKGFVGRYLPLLAPIPASAEVSIRNGESLEIRAVRSGEPLYTKTIPAPALAYTSHNYYWFQQEYSYQLGGVFLRQWNPGGGKVTLITAPPLSIYAPDGEEDTRTKIELVVVKMTTNAGGIGATSPIRVDTGLNADPAAPVDADGKTWPAEFSDVTLTFHATSNEAAQAWADAFTGAAARNHLGITAPKPDTDDATITIAGPSANAATNDVSLDLLVADYSMSLENVPTMIE